VKDDANGIALTTCFPLVLHKRHNTLTHLFAVACTLVACVRVHIGARIEPHLIECRDSLIAQAQYIHKLVMADIKGKYIPLALSHPYVVAGRSCHVSIDKLLVHHVLVVFAD
jgi:hypothetical protein